MNESNATDNEKTSTTDEAIDAKSSTAGSDAAPAREARPRRGGMGRLLFWLILLLLLGAGAFWKMKLV